MFEGGVRVEDSIVRLHYCRWHLKIDILGRDRGCSPAELDRWRSRVLTSCHSQQRGAPTEENQILTQYPLRRSGRWGIPEQELRDTTSCANQSGWRHLKAGALVCHPPDPIHGHLDLLLTDGVVASSIVVRSVLLTSDQLLRMEQLPICSSSNLYDREESKFKPGLIWNKYYLVHHSRLKVYKDCPWHVLPRSCRREEGGEGVVRGLILVFLTIWHICSWVHCSWPFDI